MNRTLQYIALIYIFNTTFPMNSISQTQMDSIIQQDKLVGNVYGIVNDVLTSEPINGAQIFLFDISLQKTTTDNHIRTTNGNYMLPDFQSAVKHGISNNNGEFLINFVPTPYPFKFYTIIIKASGYNLFIINSMNFF